MKVSLNFGAFVDGLSVFLIGVAMVFALYQTSCKSFKKAPNSIR